MPDKKLAVFTTGGTIDSRSSPDMDGAVVPLQETLVGRFLADLQLHFQLEIQEICRKDSRSITDDDRLALIKAIDERGAKHNLVTHGTFTMPDTARFLAGRIRDKVVILTGSLSTMLGTVDDYGRLIPSDAQFNLGYAVSEAFHAPDGVYVAMNGRLFTADEVWKDLANRGRFESKIEKPPIG